MEAQEDGAYDYAFSDFWGGYYDGVDLYMQFMPLTARFSRTKHSYWIESCFMEYFFRPVFMRLLMEKGLGQRVKLPERSREVRALQDEFFRYMETQPLSIASADDIDPPAHAGGSDPVDAAVCCGTKPEIKLNEMELRPL